MKHQLNWTGLLGCSRPGKGSHCAARQSFVAVIVVILGVALAAGPVTLGADGHHSTRINATQQPTSEVPVQGASAPAEPLRRNRQEVNALIAQAGRTPPDWWDSVTPDYLDTLDLTWPEPKRGEPWDPKKNLGQYLWSVINENPGRWTEGVKLLHSVLMINEANPATVKKTMNRLGEAYHDWLQDWARAAFWWQKAGAGQADSTAYRSLRLAHCYWKLGSKKMAVQLLRQWERRAALQAISLWAEVGELGKAIALARDAARQPGAADIAWLAAGNACRTAGKPQQAMIYYRKVLAVNRGSHDLDRNKERVRASIEAIKYFDLLDLKRVPDGTYRDSSRGYIGPVEVEVVVKDSRIESVQVSSHKEDRPLASIDQTTTQIIAKQGVKGVDTTTGATVTSEALINATAKALAKAMK